MANGPQIAEQNYQRFKEWILEKTDADFKALERRGVISRIEILKECGFARSALIQNPRIKSALKELEDGLRARNILPPEIQAEETGELPIREGGTQKRMFDVERLRRLEQENAALKQENAELKRQLSKYTLLQEALALTGRIPR
jgi:hypothetical protein